MEEEERKFLKSLSPAQQKAAIAIIARVEEKGRREGREAALAASTPSPEALAAPTPSPAASPSEAEVRKILNDIGVSYRGKMVGTYYVNPFAVPTGYAATLIFSVDPSTQDVSILTGVQLKNRKDRSQGIRPFLTYPSGYMRPVPPSGTVIKRDEAAEEAKFTGEDESPAAAAASTAQVDIEGRDIDLRANALRELSEEVPILREVLRKEDLHFVGHLGNEAYSSATPSGDILHTIGNFYYSEVSPGLLEACEPGDDLCQLVRVPLGKMRVDLSDTRPRRVGNPDTRTKIILPEDVTDGESVRKAGEQIPMYDHYGAMTVAALNEIVQGLIPASPELKDAVIQQWGQVLGFEEGTDQRDINAAVTEFLKRSHITDIPLRHVQTSEVGTQVTNADLEEAKVPKGLTV